MEIMTETQNTDITIMRPSGRLDLHTAAQLKQEATELIENGKHWLVIDLANVSFVDSTGLGALVGSMKGARRAGGDLRIAQPNDQVQSILELTMLNRILQPYASIEETIANFPPAN